MIIQKKYALLLVGTSLICCAGEYFSAEQDTRKRHERIRETTREMNANMTSILYNQEQVNECIEKTKKENDRIKETSAGHYIFVRRYGRIISVSAVNLPSARL